LESCATLGKVRDAPRRGRQFMIELTLYTRNDCELCREMEEVIAAEIPSFAARVRRIEIDGDADLEARFGTEVPVLFVNERKAFKYRCTPKELRKRLQREVEL
jgi:glutaredoxin